MIAWKIGSVSGKSPGTPVGSCMDGPGIMRWLASRALLGGVLAACAAPVPVEMPESGNGATVVFGRILTVLTGSSSRPYEPKVSFFEVLNQGTGNRTKVDVNSNDTVFLLQLHAGDYEVTRVQIHEGPFTALADLALTFHVGQERVAYLGTWRIGVEQPRNDRQLLVSIVHDQEDQAEAMQRLMTDHEGLAGQAVTTLLPLPATSETALYEVMPYPRVVPYFRRHW